MDLRQLRYFVAILQCGSITRAATQLNVAQPALSLHIRNMEADLGVPLLFRTPQGVQPTEAGSILLHRAQAILAQFEQAQAEIRDSVAEPAGDVRLGLPSAIGPMVGVPLVMAARARFPKIRLRVADAMSGYVLDWLRLGRVDLGLLYGAVDDRGLRSAALLSEALVLLGPAGADGPAGDTATLAALDGRDLLLPGAGHGLRDLVDAAARDAGLRLAPAVEIDAYGAIKTMVERGHGYSVLPAHAVRDEAASGRLRLWHFEPRLIRTVHLAAPTDRPLSPAVIAIETLARQVLAELVGSGEWHQARIL